MFFKKSLLILVFSIYTNCLFAQVFCVNWKEKGSIAVIDKNGKIKYVIDSLKSTVDTYPDLPDSILVAHPKDWNQFKSYFINLDGKIIATIPDFKCSEFYNGISVGFKKISSQESVYAYFDTRGNKLNEKRIIQGTTDFFGYFNKNLICYRNNPENEIRIKDLLTGKENILPKEINSFSNNFPNNPTADILGFVVKGKNYNDLFGYINIKNNMIIPAKFQRIHPFSEGLAYVQENDLSVYFIDEKGKKILGNSEIGFASYYPFSTRFVNGLANVSNTKSPKILPIGYPQCGYINKKGEWIIKPDKQYISASHFKDDMAVVLQYQSADRSYITKFIDTTGKTILSGVYGDHNWINLNWNKDFIYIQHINTLFDRNGKIIWEPNFASMFVTTKIEFEKANPEKIEYLRYDDDIDSSPLLQTKFEKCRNLERLQYSSSNTELLEKIGGFKNLKKLYIYGRFKEFPKKIYKLQNLEELELSVTNIKSLNNDLLNLPKLKKIVLESNSGLSISNDFRQLAKEKNITIKEIKAQEIKNLLD
jgi:Leucine-rich repeat (LRR) protein